MPLVRLAGIGLLASAVLFAGCDDDTTEPEQFNPAGSVAFVYEGAISGSYSAAGTLDPDATSLPTGGATAVLDDTTMMVVSLRLSDAAHADVFALLLGTVDGTGSFGFAPMRCDEESLGACRIGLFARDVDPTQLPDTLEIPTQVEDMYVLALGTVTVTSRTPLRLRGRFSGTAYRMDDPTGQTFITISDGSFDVPIRDR